MQKGDETQHLRFVPFGLNPLYTSRMEMSNISILRASLWVRNAIFLSN